MTWKRVCSTSDIAANCLKLFDVDGISILIVSHSGDFKAIPPLCPHMEEPLASSGICDGKVLTCTKHLWQWDLVTNEPQAETEKPLLIYELKVEGDDIQVFIEHELEYEFDEEDDDEDDDLFWDD
ncbi:MAG: (2Fe-2S)-binding protein [Alphaproteobacteria bacterium]|nr:(2Fe-2S)-binding protein [Alphaproteobacteria bacterium]|tara:strand:+ start:9339 stop:9713 length:375 start_codon:yes stop_codon:yes gene_type:complete